MMRYLSSLSVWMAVLLGYFGFVALRSTRKTRVLISSIFFMADSVVTGAMMMRYLSSLSVWMAVLLGYFGSRAFCGVFGLKKCTFWRTFFTLRDTAVFTALATFSAFFAPPFAMVLKYQK